MDFAASRSCTDAAVISTVTSRPIVLTAKCPLAAVDLLARVEAAADADDLLGGLDRHGVEDRCGGLGFAGGRDPALIAHSPCMASAAPLASQPAMVS
jgi:hypothetical protein